LRKLHPKLLAIATRGTHRAINRQVVLNLLRAYQPISRAELARRLRMQRGAIGRIVNGLIRDGLVREGGPGDTDRGRKPTLLHLDSRGRWSVAVDVRVTRTFLVITDLIGNELSPVRSFVTDADPKAFTSHLAGEVRRLVADHSESGECHGVGIAFPGMLDRTGSIVLRAPALGWRNVPFKSLLSAAIGLPVEVENAARACVFAQMWSLHGEAPPGDLAFVSVSDGLGVGLLVAGEVLRGRHNIAGEFGHLPLDLAGPPCACGAVGCWEAYVSNLATVSRYLGTPIRPGHPVSSEVAQLSIGDFMARVGEGDAKAVAALASTAHYLGLGLASIVNSFDPDRIYIGGEIMAAWDLMKANVRRGLAQRALLESAADVEIVPVAAHEHPRLRGASALVGAQIFVAGGAATA
jgi:N-acetylglucosamine repressor